MSGSFKLKNDMLLLSTEAPGGIYNSAQLKKIAVLCDGDAAIVKATEDQRLALFVAPDKADQVAAALKETGLGVRRYQEGLHQPTTCIGSSCSEALQDAMGSSIDVTEALSGIALSAPLKIGINGCARCCVPTHTLDISVIGEAKGYRVSLGGKNSQIPEMAAFMAEGVPAAELPTLLRKVVDLYQQHVEGDETLQDVMERVGAAPFVEALAPYSQDAAADADPFGGIGGGDDLSLGDGESDALDLGDLPDAEAIEDLGDAGDDGAAAFAASELPEAEQVADNEFDLTAEPSKDDDLLLEDEVFEAGDASESGELSLGDEALDLDLEPETIGPQEGQAPAVAEARSSDEELSLEDDELAADEVSDDEADAFEEKIALAVEEEETLGTAQDENADQRLEAMQLVEANAELGDQVVHGDSDFEDLEIDGDLSLDAPARVRPLKAGGGDDAWRFAGIDLDEAGRVVLHFASGVTVALDPEQLDQSRDLSFGGKRVTFTASQDGIHVEVDGVGLYLPRNAA